MRACIFVSDLRAAASRKASLVRQLADVGHSSIVDVCFVGIRETGPVGDETPGYVPYVPREEYLTARIGNTVLRLADAGLAPRQAVISALSRCAEAFVEAILATEPDVVLLDVPWGRELLQWIEPEFPGRVYVAGDRNGQSQSSTDTSARDAKVSIVLPTYNGTKYLRQSIRSCIEQTHRNIELIIVDDGSREDIGGVVAEFHDGRIHYVRHQTNRGLPSSLNTGFDIASGEYLTWTSDDNYYAPDAIERMTTFLQWHSTFSFVYSSMYIVDEQKAESLPKVRRALPPGDLRYQNNIGGCFLYTREVRQQIGEYQTGATLVEDYDYWIRVSKRFRMQRLVAPLYYYRYHDQSLTSQHTREDVTQRFELVRQQNGIA